jgi:hypothetical protein
MSLLLSLKGKTITDVHVSADKTGQPVSVTLWFDDGPPVLVGSDEHGLLVSVDTLDEQIEEACER